MWDYEKAKKLEVHQVIRFLGKGKDKREERERQSEGRGEMTAL